MSFGFGFDFDFAIATDSTDASVVAEAVAFVPRRIASDELGQIEEVTPRVDLAQHLLGQRRGLDKPEFKFYDAFLLGHSISLKKTVRAEC